MRETAWLRGTGMTDMPSRSKRCPWVPWKSRRSGRMMLAGVPVADTATAVSGAHFG